MRFGVSRLLPARFPLTVPLLSIGLALCLMHLHFTDYQSFSYDIDGHRQYIEFIAGHRALPRPDDCWQCWQPPLYYVAGSLFYAVARHMGMHNPIEAVRYLSFLCYLIFLYYGVRLLRENILSRPAYYTALSLLLFWPLGFAKATLINNDVPLYMAQLGGGYYLLRWWRHLEPRDLGRALLWNALAFNFKNNAIVLTAIIAAAVLCRWAISRFPIRTVCNRRVIAMLALALLLGLLPLARNYHYYRMKSHSDNSLLVSNIRGLPGRTWIRDDRPRYYLTFDVHNYFAYPFNYPPNGEWRYFWNGVLKSSLFGEREWKPHAWGARLNLMELALLYYLLGSAVVIAMQDKARAAFTVSGPLPFLLFTGIQVAALLVYRIIYPNVCSDDYRYIYATIPVLALLYAKAIQWHQQHRLQYLARLGVVLGAAFVVISIRFILGQDL